MHIGSLLGALSSVLTAETSFGHMALIEPSLALPGLADPIFLNPAHQEESWQSNAGLTAGANVVIAFTSTSNDLKHSPVVYGAEISHDRVGSVAPTVSGGWTPFETRQPGNPNLFGNIFSSQAADQSSVSIEQIGADNRIAGSQGGDRSSVFIAQIGDLHTATIVQSGRNNDLVLVQQITTNRAVLSQSGTDGALALAQDGEGNSASILQLGAKNVAEIHQLGNDNLVLVRQSGEAGAISVSQKGLGQFVEVIQASGTRNSVSVIQNSNFSTAFVSQSGSLNYAQINQ